MTGTRSFVGAALITTGFAMWVPHGLASPLQAPADRAVQVTWKSVRTADGTRQAVPVLSPDTGVDGQVARQIVAVEETYRVAKLNNDIQALDRILSPDYYGTNQNGNSRNKQEAIELFTSFPITSLMVDRATIRFSGTNVTVTGEQTEVNATGTDRMLFTRVYVPDGADSWLLLSNTQFRNPHTTR
jgi:hypothetical protein